MYKSPWWMSNWFFGVTVVLFLVASYPMGVLMITAAKEAAKNLPTIKVEVVETKDALTPPVVELGEATDGGSVK